MTSYNEISIDNIDAFPEHPFKVLDNLEMDSLVESIKSRGVLEPVIVRKKEDNRYEMISGHRRMRASLLAGKNTIPCIVKDYTDSEATIMMVDSNLHREELLPSEKAFAYKMKLEAIKHQGKQISRQIVGRLESSDVVGQDRGESGRTVQRYIRLTNLIPEILQMVDNKIMALSPAEKISFLSEELQLALLDYMQYYCITPSYTQAIEMKTLFEKGKLDVEKINQIMEREKPNQVEKIKLDVSRLRGVLPKNIDHNKIEDYVVKALVHYGKYLRQKQIDPR